ncbi:hypothetical protein HGRIS_000953 [Hohenbuehelia grisea]|uniref:DUF6534 domain-containing protein n=1 Tax=Hohenbuehelia grisea TaxID=104357 RepID=A0ABR3IQD8_9AGAR
MVELPFNLDRTIGAAFLGNVAAGIFYGITSLQTYIYFRNAFKDGRSMKCLIFTLWILDSLHLALTTHGMYFYLVTNFTNPLVIGIPTWCVDFTIMKRAPGHMLKDLYLGVYCVKFTSLALVTSLFDAFLQKEFGDLVATLYVTGSGIAFATRGFIAGTFAKLMRDSWLLYSALGSAVFADIFIACSLCILLRSHRTGSARTDSLVNILMLYSINTGLLTSLCATASFITYAIWPRDFVFMGIYFTLSKLYLNSLLASLNARTLLREREHQHSSQPVGVTFKFTTPPDTSSVMEFSASNLRSFADSPCSHEPTSTCSRTCSL